MLAFVESTRSLPGALAFARERGASSITFVSEDYLTEREIPFDGTTSAVLFGDYRPDDLDRTVLDQADSFLHGLFETNPGLKDSFTWKNEDLSPFMTYPFTDIAQHCLRTAVIMKRIRDEHRPDLVYADDYWRRFTGLTDIKTSNPPGFARFHAWKCYRIVMILFWLGAGLFFKLLGPIVLAKLLGFKIPGGLRDKEILLVGNYRQNNRIRKIWSKVEEKCHRTAELYTSGRYPLKILLQLASCRSRGLIGSLVRPGEIPRLTYRYLKLACAYFLSDVGEPFELTGRNYNFNRLLLDRIILLTAPSALVFAAIKPRFEEMSRLRCVLFSVPAAWCTILSSLESRKVETVASTHGMSLSPLGYRSNFAHKIVHSSFDSSVLSLYSDDENYVPLSMTPDRRAAPDPRDDSLHLRENLIRISAGSAAKEADDPLQGRNAAILTSSNIKRGFMRKFLAEGVEHFSSHREKYGIDYIAVKLHPDSDIDLFESDLEEIVRDRINLPVYLTKTVKIDSLLRRSAFAVSMPSSIMLDLLLMEVPFSLFTKCTMVDRSLIMRFAYWMRFKTFDDLDSIRAGDLQSFPRLAGELRRLFWEYEGNKGLDHEEMADFIVNRPPDRVCGAGEIEEGSRPGQKVVS